MKFSVVITTCGRPGFLKDLLSSIVKTGFLKKNLDIIVVDDDRRLAGLAMAKEFSRRHDLAIKTFRGGFCGPSKARNIGIANSINEVVVLLDDDVIVSENYFEECIKMLIKYPKATLIGGRNLSVSVDVAAVELWRKKWVDDPWMLAETVLSDTKDRPLVLREELFASNMCLRKSHFVGDTLIFDEQRLGRKFGKWVLFGEDYELVLRMVLAGKQVVYDPALVCRHQVSSQRLEWRYYWRRMALAGLEQRLIDETYTSVPVYESFRGQWETVRQTVKDMIVKKKWSMWPVLIGKWLFAANYFWGFRVFRIVFGF